MSAVVYAWRDGALTICETKAGKQSAFRGGALPLFTADSRDEIATRLAGLTTVVNGTPYLNELLDRPGFADVDDLIAIGKRIGGAK